MLILKKGREKPILQKHHWIFSGAVEKMPKMAPGSIVPVGNFEGNLLGYAMFHPKVSLVGRMVSFGPQEPLSQIRSAIRTACKLRNQLFDLKKTNAFRLIHAEADGLPGLVVDQYDRTLVVQILTLGMENIRDLILQTLIEECNPKAIYEKSIKQSRIDEGLSPKEGVIFGEMEPETTILENEIRFLVSPEKGQKTGFFLDQRNMRQLIQQLSKAKRVLNCFSYTGGFSVAALKGGATHVDSIDTSQFALDYANRHVSLNGLEEARHKTHCVDVVSFLREHALDYDLIILDPPAFIKKRTDVQAGTRGYRELNRLALQKMNPGSLLLTCSCSAHLPKEEFQKILFQAALGTEKQVRILERHRLAYDHPINIFHPETEYLKSLLLFVSEKDL